VAINPWRGLKNLPRELWILCTALLVNRAGLMALPFLVLYLTRSLGIPPGRAALALIVYGAGALITAPLSGRLSDRVGAHGVLKWSLFLSGGILLLFPLARSFGAILATTFFWAILGEAGRPASFSIIADLVAPEQRKPAFALGRLALNLGTSVGPAVGGFLALISFHALFLVDGATSILAGAVLALAPWRASRQVQAQPADSIWNEPSELAREIEAEGGAPLPSPPARDLSVFVNPRLAYFLAALLPVHLVIFQLLSALPLFLVRHLGLPEAVYGLVFTVNTLMIVLIEVPLNTAMAHWPHRWALALGALLYGAGYGALAFTSHTAGVAATVVVWTFGEMILLPGSAAYIAEIAPAEKRGQYMGFYAMSFNLAFLLGPWIGAQILERSGPQVLWSITFLSGCVSALLMTRIHPTAATAAAGD